MIGIKHIKNVVFQYYSLLPLLVVAGYYLWRAVQFEIHDFSNYYYAAEFLKKGWFDYKIYFPYEFSSLVTQWIGQNQFLSFAPNTPFLAWFFVPLTYVPIDIAKLIFNWISVGLMLVAIQKLKKELQLSNWMILLFPLVFLVPLKNDLLFGQVYLLMFFLLSSGYIAFRNEQYLLMGLFWGLASLLKVFPLILVGFLLARKEYKALSYWVGITMILVGFSIVFTGWEIWYFYFTQVINRFANGEIAGSFVDHYQSLFMFLKRFFVFDNLENTTVIWKAPALFWGIILVTKGLLIGSAFFISRQIKGSFFSFALWLFIGIVLSPYGSTYLLINVIFLFMAISKINLSLSLRSFLFVCVFIMANSSLLSLISLPEGYSRLYMMIGILGLLGWHFRKVVPYLKILVGMVFIALVYAFYIPSTDNWNHFSDTKLPLLVYDYGLENDIVYYSYWDENGSHTEQLTTDIVARAQQEVEIVEQQIFVDGVQITFDSSNKRKAIKINENQVLFLSDRNQGIGFYNLWTIEINTNE